MIEEFSTYESLMKNLKIRDEDKIAYYSIDENNVVNLWRVNGNFGGITVNLKYCEENLLPLNEANF